MPNDVLFRDARLLSGQRADVLVLDGVIAAIGEVGAHPWVEDVDLGGRYLSPGMWDEHLHFTQWVIRRQRFDLSRTRSAADVLETAAAELARGQHGEVLVGYGFRDGTWPDAPTQVAIDAVSPTVPLVLISGDLHCAWMNTVASHVLGVETDDTGLVREGPWIHAADQLAQARFLPMGSYREAAEAAARRGVVGVVEYEHADALAEWTQRIAAGIDQLRVDVAVWPDRLDDAIARGVRTGDALEATGLARMGRLKVVVDGSLNTRTALCWDPYPGLDVGHPHPCGIASVSVDDLRDLLVRAKAAGIEAAVHAIGDRANSEVLDVFEELGMHGIIEHAQLVSERDFPRFAQLGLIASVQPEHAMDDRDVADRHWAGRTGRAFAFGSLHRTGAQLRLGSDAPVAPLDPWEAIASATTRSRGDREAWHPEQIIPFDVAFAASTRGRPGIAVGEVADLAVLDLDPATASRDDLRALPVSATLVAGRFTHRAL